MATEAKHLDVDHLAQAIVEGRVVDFSGVPSSVEVIERLRQASGADEIEGFHAIPDAARGAR